MFEHTVGLCYISSAIFTCFFFFCMAQPLTSTRVHRFWLDVLFLLPVVCKLFNLQCDQLVLDFSFLVSFVLGFFPAKAKQNFKKNTFFCWCCYCSCWLNMSFSRNFRFEVQIYVTFWQCDILFCLLIPLSFRNIVNYFRQANGKTCVCTPTGQRGMWRITAIHCTVVLKVYINFTLRDSYWLN